MLKRIPDLASLTGRTNVRAKWRIAPVRLQLAGPALASLDGNSVDFPFFHTTSNPNCFLSFDIWSSYC